MTNINEVLEGLQSKQVSLEVTRPSCIR